MRMNKILACLLIVTMFASIMCTGCARKNLDGRWVLVKKIKEQGQVITASDLNDAGIVEEFIIEGDSIKYSSKQFNRVIIDANLILKDIGDSRYTFNVTENNIYALVTVDGNEISYYSHGYDGATKMVYKKA